MLPLHLRPLAKVIANKLLDATFGLGILDFTMLVGKRLPKVPSSIIPDSLLDPKPVVEITPYLQVDNP